MSDISFIGSYSGIDKAAIDKLMIAEKMPLVHMSNKKTNIVEKQNAWKDINTRLNSLFEKIKVLQNPDTFTAKKATSTNEDIVTMTASKNAAEGVYRVNVERLATNTTVIGGNIPEGSMIDGKLTQDGSFTIKNNDGVEVEIEVKEGDSLKDVADRINAVAKDYKDENGEKIEGTGITATIIDGRMVLNDGKSGARDITLEGDGQGTLVNLGLNDTAIDVKKGQNAKFTINGVEVVKDSNRVSDVIDGVTINLNKAHKAGEYDTVTVGLDTEKISKAVQDFVDQYNSTMKFIEEKMEPGDPEVPGSRGILAGDSSLMRLHDSLRRMVTDKQGNGNTDIKDISQLGVTTIDKWGQLKFDSKKFMNALAENPEDVINFFYSKGEDDKELGFVPRLNGYIDSFVSKKNGIIKTKTESYDKALKDLNRQIEVFNDRMERKEKQYIKMFTALDTAMMKAEGQMSWLQSQMDVMNSMGGRNRK